jgi:hypothetical protein
VSALLTSREAAERIGTDPRRLSDWRKRFGLEPAGRCPQGWLYRWEDVIEADRRRQESLRKAPKSSRKPKPRKQKPASRRSITQRQRARVRYALDLVDLAHMTSRGDVDLKTWVRVCRGRFQQWPPERVAMKRALERWKARLRAYRIPFGLVNCHGEPVDSVGNGLYGSGEGSLLRFDWPNVLRWAKHVLG